MACGVSQTLSWASSCAGALMQPWLTMQKPSEPVLMLILPKVGPPRRASGPQRLYDIHLLNYLNY